MLSIRRILHPTDLKEKTAPAFGLACDLARLLQAELSVVHVAPTGTTTYLSERSERDDDQLQEKLWQALTAGRPEERDLKVSHRIAEGDPANAILRAAEETGADLLVVGRSSSTKVPICWLNATTLDDLVHRAPCPVLISTPREHVPQKEGVFTGIERNVVEPLSSQQTAE